MKKLEASSIRGRRHPKRPSRSGRPGDVTVMGMSCFRRNVKEPIDKEAGKAGTSDKAREWHRFAAKLRDWRETNNKKIADAASEFGVATSTWGHWETGSRLPSGENLMLLGKYTGMPVVHFFCANSGRCPFATPSKSE